MDIDPCHWAHDLEAVGDHHRFQGCRLGAVGAVAVLGEKQQLVVIAGGAEIEHPLTVAEEVITIESSFMSSMLDSNTLARNSLRLPKAVLLGIELNATAQHEHPHLSQMRGDDHRVDRHVPLAFFGRCEDLLELTIRYLGSLNYLD